MDAKLNEIAAAAVFEALEEPLPIGWRAFHTEDALDETKATKAISNLLPHGFWIDSLKVYGYGAGIDGTIILVKTGYSHS